MGGNLNVNNQRINNDNYRIWSNCGYNWSIGIPDWCIAYNGFDFEFGSGNDFA
jgi:hypothetical protein